MRRRSCHPALLREDVDSTFRTNGGGESRDPNKILTDSSIEKVDEYDIEGQPFDGDDYDDYDDDASKKTRTTDNDAWSLDGTEAKPNEDGVEDDIPTENNAFDKCRGILFKGLKYISFLLLVAYVVAALVIDFQRAIALFVCAVVVIIWNIWAFVAKRNESRIKAAEHSFLDFMTKVDTDRRYAAGLYSVFFIIMAVMMSFTVRDARNLISLFGLIVFLTLSWLTSYKPSDVKFRPVVISFFMQFLFGFVVIRTAWGLAAMQFLGDLFTTLVGFTKAGSSFVFSWLTDDSLFATPFQLANGGSYTLGPPIVFGVLPTVIFFSSLMSVGYYIRVLPWCVQKVGWFFGITMGTSASETFSAAGNIFLGGCEAPLLIRPFMKNMTASELHALMTGGFATIAGGVFGIYISFGIDASAILGASIMSAPAALAISKIVYPETEESKTATIKGGTYNIPKSEDANVVDAATNGAATGTRLLINITGNAIAFLAIIAMLDAILAYLGELVDISLSFTIICSYVFWPVAWLMGIDTEDCEEIAIVLGYKVFTNEFVAYQQLAFTFKDQISARSYYIASFAICGFSNFGSVGIMLGGLTPLAPNKRKIIAKLVISSMIAGNTACLMTACIAGVFYQENTQQR